MIGLKQKIMMAGLALGIGAVWTPQILDWTGGADAPVDDRVEVPNESAGVVPLNVQVHTVVEGDPEPAGPVAVTPQEVESPAQRASVPKAIAAIEALRASGAGVDLSILSEVGGTAASTLTTARPGTERPDTSRADHVQEWLAASTLTATLVGGARPLALFGSHVLHVGDEVIPGVLTVSGIGSDHVLFSAGDREHRVELPAFQTTGRSRRSGFAGQQELVAGEPEQPSRGSGQDPQ